MNITLTLLIVFCVRLSKSEDYCKGHFENCTCTDEKVQCHREAKLKGNITKLFHYIKDDVSEIIITGCDFKELPVNTFGSCRQDTSLRLKKLKRVDLSNNSIRMIHGKSFHCMPNLKSLILRDNAWEVDRYTQKNGYFTSMPNLKYLDLTNAFDEVWDGYIHFTKLARVFNETDMTTLETLKLGYNEFYLFPLSTANSFCQLTSLKTLDLSHNNLVDPSLPNKKNCLEHLEHIDLSYNEIAVLPNEFMDKVEHLRGLQEIKLDNNPFYCDCRLVETWKWLSSTKIAVNKDDLKCADGYLPLYVGKPVLSLTLSDLRCKELDPSANTAVKAANGMIFAIVGPTFLSLLTFRPM